MMPTILLRAATEKVASSYYLRNRAAILARQRQYRAKNQMRIQKRRKRYQREVNSGMRRQKTRIKQGNSYIFGGFR